MVDELRGLVRRQHRDADSHDPPLLPLVHQGAPRSPVAEVEMLGAMEQDRVERVTSERPSARLETSARSLSDLELASGEIGRELGDDAEVRIAGGQRADDLLASAVCPGGVENAHARLPCKREDARNFVERGLASAIRNPVRHAPLGGPEDQLFDGNRTLRGHQALQPPST